MRKIVLPLVIILATSLMAKNFYLRTSSDATSWSNITMVPEVDELVTLPDGDSISSFISVGNDTTIYLAPGTYYLPITGKTFLIKTGKVYGGFSGNESTIDLNARAVNDKDGNGIVEPWEFTNEAVITTSNPAFKFSGSGITTGSRFIVISGTGGELNGVTVLDLNYLTYAGPICLGQPSGTPSAANNVLGKEGVMRLCTVKKVRSAIGIVMSTNKYSIIDRCLIESNVVTAINTGGAVFMNACGGKITGSVVRNNAATGTGGRGAGVLATSLSATHMDAIVENSVIYNNFAVANGCAIRGDAQSGKRGIEIVNSTIVNNQTASTASGSIGSIEIINAGSIVNNIVVGDPSAEVRANNANNYIVNNVYGEYATGSAALNGSGNATGKIVADLFFTNPTTFAGVMIPDFTTPWDQAKYDAIRSANFSIANAESEAVKNAGLMEMPASYTYSTTTVPLTATIPSTDIKGNTRTGDVTIGAYQFSNLSTSTHKLQDGNTYCTARDNQLFINNANGLNINIFSLSGQRIQSLTPNADVVSISLEKGIYIVRSDKFTEKVIVQ